MVALAEFPGSVKDGGKGRDNVRVKRRVVIDVPLGRGSHACYKNMRFMMHLCSHRSRQQLSCEASDNTPKVREHSLHTSTDRAHML
jgi:threonine dehydrogenase-like Zn-dependent dehydrogenase